MTRQQLMACTKDKLSAMARKRGIAGYASMPKEQLIRALVRAGQAARINGVRTHRKAVRPHPQPAAARKTTRNGTVVKHVRRAKPLVAAADRASLPPRELPAEHAKDRLVVMVRDPFWLHCYWELTRHALQRAEAALGQDWHGARPILRLFDVSSNDTTSATEAAVRDILIHGGCNNWYLDVANPPRSYRVDIGYLSKRGRFFVLARSNVVTTPKPGSGDTVDGNWADIDVQQANRIYAMSAGFDPHSTKLELKEIFEERLGKPLGAPAFASLGAGPLLGKQRRFAFQLDADLIVYGQTEPHARVMIQGEPVKLRPDGSFTMRFRLPDSRQILPATARSADGLEERTIVLAVERNTKHLEPMMHDMNE